MGEHDDGDDHGDGDGDEARDHFDALDAALAALRADAPAIAGAGRDLATRLVDGARLLVAGNGGSAALGQHLTAELVGRYRVERRPLSALALHADTSTVTAIVNDYPPETVFARQVRAHARPGDVVLLLSTSGRSPNLLAAVDAARAAGADTWAMTGAAPNPLADAVDRVVVAVPSAATATVQEVHQVVVHLLCAAVDGRVGGLEEPS